MGEVFTLALQGVIAKFGATRGFAYRARPLTNPRGTGISSHRYAVEGVLNIMIGVTKLYVGFSHLEEDVNRTKGRRVFDNGLGRSKSP